jgi:serine/threonine-protein kinase RsbW
MAGEYRIDGLAVPESLELLHELLERVAREHPEVSPADLMMFETAVIEIAGNVVEHGEPAGQVSYGFCIEVLPDRLHGCLSDSGDAVSRSVPGSMPDEWDENGRGLALAGSVVDELSYSRVDGENHWRMTRLRRPQT